MQITDIYIGGSHQMRHCNPCEMPAALDTTPGSPALYRVTRHAIIETKAVWRDEEGLQYMREEHEKQGTLAIFEAALKCIRCAEGITLIIDGKDTGWSVGGSRAVE